MSEALINRLIAHRTIGSAPREELEWIAAHGKIRKLATGELLSSRLTPVQGLYFVLSGLITIHVDRGAGSRRVMEAIGMRYVRTYFPPWEEALPDADRGEVEYEITRGMWQARSRD